MLNIQHYEGQLNKFIESNTSAREFQHEEQFDTLSKDESHEKSLRIN